MTKFQKKSEKQTQPKKDKKERKYNNKTTYNRVEHCSMHPYTKISNYLIDDLRLSFIEKGFMMELLKNNDTYIFNSDYMQEHISKLGQVVYDQAKANLIKYGYIEQKRIFGGVEYVINEVPKGSLFHSQMINTPCVLQSCRKSSDCKISQMINTPLIITNTIGKPIEKKPTEKNNQIENITNEKPNLEKLVVGDVTLQSLASQPSASLAPSLTPQQGIVEMVGLNDNTPKVIGNDNTSKDFDNHTPMVIDSVYFETKLALKFFEKYNSNDFINSTYNFHQFQTFLIFCILDEYSKVINSKKELIEFLDIEFDNKIPKFIKQILDNDNIQFLKKNEQRLESICKPFRF